MKKFLLALCLLLSSFSAAVAAPSRPVVGLAPGAAGLADRFIASGALTYILPAVADEYSAVQMVSLLDGMVCTKGEDTPYSAFAAGISLPILVAEEEKNPLQERENIETFLSRCSLFKMQKSCQGASRRDDMVVVAYVTSWEKGLPDPFDMTIINYAFGHVTDSFDGMRIDNEKRLREIVALKKINPDLKVMVSVGGWGSGRFSEMVASKANRKGFINGCLQKMKEFDLDGIDLDWEYPTSSAAKISSSPQDKDNYTLLLKELRAKLPKGKLLTMASANTPRYYDYASCIQYLDLVNLMTYDMGMPPRHQSALYDSEISGATVAKAVSDHLKAGVPRDKLVLGIPFYPNGGKDKVLRSYTRTQDKGKYWLRWNTDARAPYLADDEGVMQTSFETPTSLQIKCLYIISEGLRGGMYWDYDSDGPEHRYARLLKENLL